MCGLNYRSIPTECDTVAQYQFFRNMAGERRWRLRANNGRIIADSDDGYKKKSDWLHGVGLVKELAKDADVKEQAELICRDWAEA